MTRPLQHPDVTGNKQFNIQLRKECVYQLFSENLPLTPSGKIKKTPALQLTEWMTADGKKIPEEADPECEKGFEIS